MTASVVTQHNLRKSFKDQGLGTRRGLSKAQIPCFSQHLCSLLLFTH